MGPLVSNDAVTLIKTTASWKIAEEILGKIAKQSAVGLQADVFEFLWCFDWTYQMLGWTSAGRCVSGSRLVFKPPDPPPAPSFINWVYTHKKSIYVKDLKQLNAGKLVKTNNVLDKESFTKDQYHEGHPETEDEIIVPMMFRGIVVGVINIEFYKSSDVDELSIQRLQNFGQHVAEALMICAAEKKRQLLFGTELRVPDLEILDFPFLQKTRSCFFATEFRGPYIAVQTALVDFLSPRGYNVHIVKPSLGKTIVAEIDRQIAGCSLFVADITSLNKNVMIETGMAISHKKTILQIYSSVKNNIPKIPFDLRNYPIYRYNLVSEDGIEKINLPEDFKKQFE